MNQVETSTGVIPCSLSQPPNIAARIWWWGPGLAIAKLAGSVYPALLRPQSWKAEQVLEFETDKEMLVTTDAHIFLWYWYDTMTGYWYTFPDSIRFQFNSISLWLWFIRAHFNHNINVAPKIYLQAFAVNYTKNLQFGILQKYEILNKK